MKINREIIATGVILALVFVIMLFGFVFVYSGSNSMRGILSSPLFHLSLLISSGWLLVIGFVLYMLNKLLNLESMRGESRKSTEKIKEDLNSVKTAKKETEKKYYSRDIDEESFKESMREYNRKITELESKLKNKGDKE